MKKLFMLLTVVALSASYAFAQNANSGVTVNHTNGVWSVFIVDCDGLPQAAPVISTNTVTKTNGFLKSVQTFDVSANCFQVESADKAVIEGLFGFDKVTFLTTPGGILKIITETKP